MRSKPTSRASRRTDYRVGASAILIVLATLAAYSNSFQGPFIFDDIGSIQENPTIRRLWPIWQTLCPPGQGQAVQRRPVVNLSLAVNYALGGLEVGGYHLFNVVTHILSGLLLFGVVRRTLKLPNMAEHLQRVSTPLALTVALIWGLHPLQTEAVDYIIQRTELLAGAFYLLTLYCFIRACGSDRSGWWYAASVASCCLGMGSKEVMMSAPLLVLIYDRTFISPSFHQVWQRRWPLYLGLACSWIILALLIPRGIEGSAVFGAEGAWKAYALGQFEIITGYLRLCLWPSPLLVDHGLYQSLPPERVWPYAVFIILLLLGTAAALRYRPWLGFLGLWFFAILAPSSSFVPLMGQPAAEKRMYLPLAAVVSLVVIGLYSLAGHLLTLKAPAKRTRPRPLSVLGYSLAAVVAFVLGLLTFERNEVYASELSIWEDAVRKLPHNSRAYNNRGGAYFEAGRHKLALADFNRAIELDPGNYTAFNKRGVLFGRQRNYTRAIKDFDKAIELNPLLAEAYNNRAIAYRITGRVDLAIRDYGKAIELNPHGAEAYYNRALAHKSLGNYAQAIDDLRKTLQLRPDLDRARKQLQNIPGYAEPGS